MSASKLLPSARPATSAPSPVTRLLLPANTVRFRKNGIEFQTAQPLTPWTEMTVDLESPRTGRRLRCSGVVVACNGTRHAGYWVSLVFTHLSRASQQTLTALAYA